MSGNRLKTLIVAGCLALECGGCRSCLVEQFPTVRVRTPWARRETPAAPPQPEPQVSSDQDRPIAPPASPSPAPPDSPDDLSQNATPAEAVPTEQSGDSRQAVQMQAAAALEKLGGQLSTDADGVVTGIDLSQTAVTDTDLKLLADCPELRELNLRGALIGDAGVEALSAAAKLEFLGLTDTQVTDVGLTHLQRLTELRFLTLGHTTITDAGLPALYACTHLEGLNLKGTSVTAAGLVELQARLPNCRIVSDVTATSAIENSNSALPADHGSQAPVPERTVPGADRNAPSGKLYDPFANPADAPPADLNDPSSSDIAPNRKRRPIATGEPSHSFEKMLTESLHEPAVLRAIAASYAAEGDWDTAATVLRVALQQVPEDHDLQFELGVAEARSGDYVSALMHLQQCGTVAVAHYNLGILMHEAGLKDASILAFRSALRYDPQLIEARTWLTQISPGQAQAAAGTIGTKPAMIGGPVIMPNESPSAAPSNRSAAADADRTEARPTSYQSAMRARLLRTMRATQ